MIQKNSLQIDLTTANDDELMNWLNIILGLREQLKEDDYVLTMEIKEMNGKSNLFGMG